MPKVKRDQGLVLLLLSHLDLREAWTFTPFSHGLLLMTAEAGQKDCPPPNLEMDTAQDYTYFISQTVLKLFSCFFLSCSFKSILLELKSKQKHFFLSFPTWEMTASLTLRRLAQPFFLIPSLPCPLLFLSLIFQPWQEKELKISCCFLASTFLSMSPLPTHTGVALPSPWMVPHICSLKLQRWEWFSSTWNTV